MDKYLNVIALNIPYPANYGGVIDIYYKLVALHQNGVRIVLHCFEYERPHAPELEEVSEFLLQHYKEWQAKGYTTSQADKSQLKQFSRQEQANQIAQLIENSMRHG